MLAEILNIEDYELMKPLLTSCSERSAAWNSIPDGPDSFTERVVQDIRTALAIGGFARVYTMSHSVVGLCVTTPEEWAAAELGTRAFRIAHLLADGKPEMQTIVKNLLVRETMRTIPGRACFVASLSHTDVPGVNALERCGFSATRTSITMTRNLDEYSSQADSDSEYHIKYARPEDVEAAVARAELPDGVLGWDSHLTDRARRRVFRNWLSGYVADSGLLLAESSGGDAAVPEPVGLLAEHVRADITPCPGFSVGSIDVVATAHEYRSNGVAARLLENSLDSFKSRGIRLAEVTASATDVTLIRHCRILGFSPVETTLTLACWKGQAG